jgi:hypothetical protein
MVRNLSVKNRFPPIDKDFDMALTYSHLKASTPPGTVGLGVAPEKKLTLSPPLPS